MQKHKPSVDIDFMSRVNSYLMLCVALMLIRIAQIINLAAPFLFAYGLLKFFEAPSFEGIFWLVLSFLATPMLFLTATFIHKLSFKLGSK